MEQPTKSRSEILKEIYEACKKAGIKTRNADEIKGKKVYNTKELLEYAKENLVFAVDAKGNLLRGIQNPNGICDQITLETPLVPVFYGNSLNGLGGKCKLDNGKEGARKISTIVCLGCHLPEKHKKLEEANKQAKIVETGKALYDLLEWIYYMTIYFKVTNPTYDNSKYISTKKEVESELDSTQLKDKDVFNFAMFKVFCRKSKGSYHIPIADSKTEAKIKEAFGADARGIKISRADFFEKDKIESVEIDPRVMEIYKKGNVETNPNYVFAEEVVKEKQNKKMFTPLSIKYSDKTIAEDIFNHKTGRNAVVIVQFNVSEYTTGSGGMAFYIKAIQVVRAEECTRGGPDIESTYHEEEEEEEDEGEAGHVDKKQKTSTD